MTPSKSKAADVSAPAPSNDDPAHLAEKINQELEKGQEHSRLLVEYMIRLGDLLIQAKESVAHGQFYPWLKENCHIAKRQAQRYMRVAQHRSIVEKADASRATHLSLTAALEAIDEKLVGKTKDSSKTQENEESSPLDYDTEVERHRERCENLERFLQDEDSIKAGPVLKRVVEDGMDKLVRDLVKLARRHGKKITSEELENLGSDPDFTAMALLAKARERIDPMEDLAPKVRVDQAP